MAPAQARGRERPPPLCRTELLHRRGADDAVRARGGCLLPARRDHRVAQRGEEDAPSGTARMTAGSSRRRDRHPLGAARRTGAHQEVIFGGEADCSRSATTRPRASRSRKTSCSRSQSSTRCARSHRRPERCPLGRQFSAMPGRIRRARLRRGSETLRGREGAAVERLSLTVPAGEICVLVGPSGGGKTTALRLVNRLIELTSGDIRIDGTSVTRRRPRSSCAAAPGTSSDRSASPA